MPTRKLVDAFSATYRAYTGASAKERQERAMELRRVMHEEVQDPAFRQSQMQTLQFKEVRRRIVSQLSRMLFHKGLAHKDPANALVRALPSSAVRLETIALLRLLRPASQPHLGMLQQQFLLTLEHNLSEAFRAVADGAGVQVE